VDPVGRRRGGAAGAPLIEDADDVESVRTLFREYAASLGEVGDFPGFEHELAALPGGYDAILLARAGGEVVGCVAVRPLGEGACEMKRLYLRPAARGSGAGRALAVASIERARSLGYEAMRLDTAPWMTAAVALYRSLGFVEIERYNDNPVADLHFMELRL
jgi:ribosomal protein S18 acetylase RimI-like enzyme